MNYKTVFNVVGKAMIIEGIMMIISALVGVIYHESTLSLLIPAAGLFALGIPLSFLKSESKNIYAKEGFVIVALCWIVLSLFGAIPFVLSKTIPNFIDALFETVSGFTTTGASVVEDLSIFNKSLMFWRVFTHFLGGMGVLVFVLAVLPNSSMGAMHIFRAESPGPSSSKIVGNLKKTARILYLIYLGFTAIMIVLLLFSGMGFYDSLLTAFSTAGTGGFGVHNGSIAYYDSLYVEIVIAVFMFLFGVNFNLFYLMLTGSVLKALKSEEFKTYIVILLVATVTIAINLLSTSLDFANALRQAVFHVSSVSSTTGFTTANIEDWPALSKGILLLLTIIGACGGSTGGGMKVARIAILFKSAIADVKRLLNPRAIVTVKYEEKPLSQETNTNVRTYFILYAIIAVICILVLSLDSFGDLFTNISATFTCLGNVGPGLTKLIGASGSFAGFSSVSKLVLSLCMLAGRLEIFPLIILFAPRTWRRG